MTKYDCTLKIKKLIDLSSKDEVAKKIGLSRPTLDSRLLNNKWKVSELFLIEKIK